MGAGGRRGVGPRAAGGVRGDKVQVALWDLATGELSRRWDWPKGRDPHSEVECLSFTPDGKRLAAADFRQYAAYIWNVTGDQTLNPLPPFGVPFVGRGMPEAPGGDQGRGCPVRRQRLANVYRLLCAGRRADGDGPYE